MSDLLHQPMAITVEERARRQDIINEARGSVRLEGIILPVEIEAINNRYVNGEISLAEHGDAIEAFLTR